MMAVQFASYLNLTINFRAIAHNQPFAAMGTDALAVLLSYFIIKRVAKAENYWTLAGMVIGGSLAAYVGMYLTKEWS